MTINVLFFASLSERLGKSSARIVAGADTTAADVWREATSGAELPDNVLVAINQDYAQLSAVVSDGDEVAFFPPVTGG